MTKKTFSGGVPATQLSGSLSASATSFTVSSATGYPSGSAGPFVICIDRGTASEEKILISGVASTTFTVASGGRGYDGTTATTHASSATVEHVLDAATISEANDHVNTTSRDDHTQYLNTTRHDVTSRHAFGAALGTPGAPAAVGTSASAGTGSVPARSDHVHALGTDSVTTAAIAAGAVTNAKLASGAVTASVIAAGTITGTQIANYTITDNNIAVGAVGTTQLANSAVTAAIIADGAVNTGELVNSAVTVDKLAAKAVTRAKMADYFTGISQSASALSSPSEGELWYDTTNHAYKQYTTATTGWVQPWNMPWGALDYAETATSQSVAAGSAGTETTVTSLASTQTYKGNRRIKLRAVMLNLSGTVSGDIMLVRIKEGSTQIAMATVTIPTAGGYVPTAVEAIITPSAASHAYTVTVQRYSGTGGWSSGAGTGQTAYFLVEDLGPTGAPA